MVIPQRRPFYTLLISLTAIAFIYISLVNHTIDQNLQKPKTIGGNVKKIVAYSLLKQIEIESEQYTCDGQLNIGAINGSVEAKDDDNETVARWGDDADGSWTKIGGGALYVFSVHLDDRLDPYRYVRIIGMIRGNSNELFYCQFSTPTNFVYATKVTITPIWLDVWNQNDTNIYFNPVMLSCRVPFGLTPKTVSVTTKVCEKEPETKFSLANNIGKKKYMFTICVKPLNFLDNISQRLIQWIEINRILGAEKIEIYVEKVKKNVRNILTWYTTAYPDQIVVREFKTISDKIATTKHHNFSKTLWQKRRYEVITYNSCFYRNIGVSQFIIPLDIDEIIVPKYVFNWKNVFDDIFSSPDAREDNFAAYMVPNTYFLGELPKRNSNNVFFLKNSFRSQFSPPGVSGKSFISTKNALMVFNHYALDVVKPGVRKTFFISSSVMQMNHYKENCNSVILPECVKYTSSPRIKDTSIFRYKNRFMEEYWKKMCVFKKLGFLF